jgi:hypothetical protein
MIYDKYVVLSLKYWDRYQKAIRALKNTEYNTKAIC